MRVTANKALLYAIIRQQVGLSHPPSSLGSRRLKRQSLQYERRFLSKQTNAFQDSVLGPNRAKLYRKGGLKLDQMVRPTGKQITLAELADMHRSAFIAAGLNPDAF
jgi:hypothetical protein